MSTQRRVVDTEFGSPQVMRLESGPLPVCSPGV